MSTNKECIKNLGTGLGGVQDHLSCMEIRMVNWFQIIEESLQRLTDVVTSRKGGSSSHHLPQPSPPLVICHETLQPKESGEPHSILNSPSWNFWFLSNETLLSGCAELVSSSLTREPPSHTRYLLHPNIWKGRPTSGGNG